MSQRLEAVTPVCDHRGTQVLALIVHADGAIPCSLEPSKLLWAYGSAPLVFHYLTFALNNHIHLLTSKFLFNRLTSNTASGCMTSLAAQVNCCSGLGASWQLQPTSSICQPPMWLACPSARAPWMPTWLESPSPGLCALSRPRCGWGEATTRCSWT